MMRALRPQAVVASQKPFMWLAAHPMSRLQGLLCRADLARSGAPAVNVCSLVYLLPDLQYSVRAPATQSHLQTMLPVPTE